MKIITRRGGGVYLILQSKYICKYFDNYLVCLLLYYNSFSRYIFNEFHDVHRRTGKISKGGQTIPTARIAPQIARIDRFLTHVKFSHAGKLLELSSNIRNMLNGENLGKF